MKKFCTLFFCLILTSLQAQNLTKKQQLQENPDVLLVEMEETLHTPSLIKLNAQTVASKSTQDIAGHLNSLMNYSTTKLKFDKTNKLGNHLTVERFDEYYGDIKVEFGEMICLHKDGQPILYKGKYFDLDQKNLKLKPSFSESEALDVALNFVGADLYVWEELEAFINNLGPISAERSNAFSKAYVEHYPEAEMVIVDNFYTNEVDPQLAYKFNIYAAHPIRRDYVYVNAHNGDIMLVNPIIKHASDIVTTRYAGDKTIQTKAIPMVYSAGTSTTPEPNPKKDATLIPDELLNSTTDPQTTFGLVLPTPPTTVHVLIDESRDNGMGTTIETYDCNGVGGVPISVPIYGQARSFTDIDNDWTPAEHVRGTPGDFTTEKNNDDIAFDAHWGAGVVYDYWLGEHGRHSYDALGADILSYVHIGVGFDNAFWNGSVMSYGDGQSFAPLTSLDVCAHEIGHAVCSSTSDLVYALESGAMNEGFSDIWAAAVEYYAISNIDANLATQANPQKPFGIGEQIDSPGNALRWMDNPKIEGDPDTYGGVNWQNVEGCDPSLANDQCGVHGNSGVLNKWFYLLSVGSGALGSGPDAAYVGTGPNADDGINDNLETYSVTGLGFVKSQDIAFGTEVMLTATATFAEARLASILYIESTYGACSPEMESTIDAWHAVGVGTEYGGCNSSGGFISPNSTALEETVMNGCNQSKIHTVKAYIVGTLPTAETVTVSGGTATENVDFTLNTPSVMGPGVVDILVEIINDLQVESIETIELTLGSSTHTISIIDDDITPTISPTKVVLIDHTFDAGSGSSWSIYDPTPNNTINNWFFDNTYGAFISNDGIAPTYDGNNGDEVVYLKSNLLDARGLSNLTLTTNFMYGGEDEIGTPLDYIVMAYSYDGVTFTEVAGTKFGAFTPGTANVNMTLDPTIFDNKQFYIAFKWLNDPLVNGGYSVDVEDIKIVADAKAVETLVSGAEGPLLGSGTDIHFLSEEYGNVIARISNVSADVPCMTIDVVSQGTNRVPILAGNRSDKVINISGIPSGVTYDLTLYYTSAELSSGDWFTNKPNLNILKVPGTDITDLSGGYSITNPLYMDGPMSAFSLYEGNFSGSGTYAITDLAKVTLDLTVLLQGPYDSGTALMNDELRFAGLLPLTEPYSGLGYTHVNGGGGETVANAGVFDSAQEGDNIVDWVFIDLRDDADPSTVLATRSALLQRDGNIVDVDGSSVVDMVVKETSYLITVRHRNHVTIRTTAEKLLSDQALQSHNFTTAQTQAFNNGSVSNDPMNELTTGVFGMWAGDSKGDENVKLQGSNNDRDAIKNGILGHPENTFNLLTYTYSEYSRLDTNMDGLIKYQGTDNDNDLIKNTILGDPNNIFNLLTYLINKQTP